MPRLPLMCPRVCVRGREGERIGLWAVWGWVAPARYVDGVLRVAWCRLWGGGCLAPSPLVTKREPAGYFA